MTDAHLHTMLKHSITTLHDHGYVWFEIVQSIYIPLVVLSTQVGIERRNKLITFGIDSTTYHSTQTYITFIFVNRLNSICFCL